MTKPAGLETRRHADVDVRSPSLRFGCGLLLDQVPFEDLFHRCDELRVFAVIAEVAALAAALEIEEVASR